VVEASDELNLYAAHINDDVSKRSLEHAQPVTGTRKMSFKFMDTKVGVLTGLSALLSGFILQSLGSFLKLPESTQSTVRELMEKPANPYNSVRLGCVFFH